MGFSLSFYPIDGDDLRADDRAQIMAFLDARGLTVDPETHGLYRVTDGVALAFDGAWTDLELDPLDQPEPLTGSLPHATLTEAECTFVFELCAAGGLMIVNPQGQPMYLGIRGVHTPEMFPDPDDAVWIDSPAALASTLGGSFGDFQDYLGRVRGR
ncbi:hypothetical protein LQ938_12945 [Microbacterium sp. cx-55]|uniref:hypothetical protein n=1 Tax=unclassified Microbacterium TaxID=2609290 RepID=UPI001CBF97A6|nr:MULTISPECIES: hypothetical protein [unclassified Microbacterium]MBZ4487828.1 hypothetical protein [Microbacterium sp. cx-55]MCC4909146.1 hypothetical protein [Microbacterium sp. cx-59]UGB34760.1 hypothetical protein LQ938_12945 [Microbacterium sp. cx-55]